MPIKAITTSLVVTALVATSVNVSLTASVNATKSDKITICHATNSHTNPYVKNTVNSSSINEKNNKKDVNGHGDHTGAVWHEGIADHSWGDIIPPFESPTGTTYAGQNWTTEAKAIYDNGCSPKQVKVQPACPAECNQGKKPVEKEHKPTCPTKKETPKKETPKETPKNETPSTPGKGSTEQKPVQSAVPVQTPTTALVATAQGVGDTLPSELPHTGAIDNVVPITAIIGAGAYAVALAVRRIIGNR